jgi:hypothetical protein
LKLAGQGVEARDVTGNILWSRIVYCGVEVIIVSTKKQQYLTTTAMRRVPLFITLKTKSLRASVTDLSWGKLSDGNLWLGCR